MVFVRTSAILRIRNVLKAVSLLAVTSAHAVDPFASNNGLVPQQSEWQGGFRVGNFDYPSQVDDRWAAWKSERGITPGPLSPQTAPGFVANVKAYLADQGLADAINSPESWAPREAGWYNMVWVNQGSPGSDGKTDPDSGAEIIQGSYTGQILGSDAFGPEYDSIPPWQNHAVILFNDRAASALGRIWKNIYGPDLSALPYPDGSVVIKSEGVTLSPDVWPFVKGSTKSYVFRPAIDTAKGSPTYGKAVGDPQIVPIWFEQLVVMIKDSVASPKTGWVFISFTYNPDAEGATVWDKATPVGAMWGNDPEYANVPSGRPVYAELQETWIAPVSERAAFTGTTLGWGGRLAGPMDVARRHDVVTVSGKWNTSEAGIAASACMSCHGSGQFPMTANLYPSPNSYFPPDDRIDAPFLLFDPGSEDWAKWFQNRCGTQPMSSPEAPVSCDQMEDKAQAADIGIHGTDYSMVLAFALMAYNGWAGNDVLVLPNVVGH